MTSDFNYKKYSLENLENWMYDAMSSAEATPQEIYDVIKGVVEENYYTYKHQASQAYELLALLNGNGKGHIEEYDSVMREKEYYEPSMPPWGHSDMEALSSYYPLQSEELIIGNEPRDYYENVAPSATQRDIDDYSTEYKGAWNSFWEENYHPEEYYSGAYENFNQFGAVQGCSGEDVITFGTTSSSLSYDEAVKSGWEMTADGFWIPPQKEDKVVKWRLPVEEVKDSDTDGTEYFITFPDDLLEAANLKPGDDVEWVDKNDGSFLLRKVTKPLGMDEC
jgi:hypothetical protein